MEEPSRTRFHSHQRVEERLLGSQTMTRKKDHYQKIVVGTAGTEISHQVTISP